jgi:hypothetical protein
MFVECIARLDLRQSDIEAYITDIHPNIPLIQDWLNHLPQGASVRVDNSFPYARGLMAYWEEER